MSEQDLGLEVGGAFASDKLIQAREALGLSAEAIQRELRLTSRVVTALESGDLPGMGQPVFARGYIRSYCKRVGVDADPFVAQYDAIIGESAPKRSRIREMASSNSSAPASMTLSKKRSALGSVVAGIVKLAVGVALLGGLAFGVSKLDIDLGGLNLAGLFGDSEQVEPADPNRLVIPGTSSGNEALAIPVEADAEPVAVAPEPEVESVLQSAAEESVETAAAAPQTEVVSSLTPTVVESTEPAVQQEAAAAQVTPQPDPAPAPTPNAEPQAEPVTTPPAADGAARVAIEFTDVSWVNIKDAKGGALFNGLAEKGRTLELSGPAPINFVIGRADAVSKLTFNGTTVDLEPFTRKNVARLTLPQ